MTGPRGRQASGDDPADERAQGTEDDEPASVWLLRDQVSLSRLQDDLRLALQMRRHARRLQQTAHDLNAPLQSLALHLDLMRQDLAGDEVEQAEDRLELVSREIARLRRMLRGALSHSQLPRPEVAGFDLRRLVREALAVLRAEARAAGVAIQATLPDRRVPLRAPRDRLKQALINLLVNALEAMPDGGRLELELSMAGGQARLGIRDTGVGLPTHSRERVCALHFTTKADGSGLGLYTSRATLRELGGDLDIGDAEGGGCRVDVRMPLADEPDAPPSRAEGPDPCSTR